MLIDTHAHVNFNAYKKDADKVIRRSLGNHIWVINAGSQYDTSKRAVEMARKYKEGVFAAVGLHPIHLSSDWFKAKVDKEEIEFKTREEKFDYQKYKKLAKSKEVVAIGEIGLDFLYKPKDVKNQEEFKEKQKEILKEQILLAKELNLPVILHCREAHKEMLEILSDKKYKVRGVLHCFVGTKKEAKKYLDLGFYLGFNGIIFKKDLADVIKYIPIGKILVETDCPYLTPPPAEGRNEPLNIRYVCKKILEIKKMKMIKDFEIQIVKNTKELFNKIR